MRVVCEEFTIFDRKLISSVCQPCCMRLTQYKLNSFYEKFAKLKFQNTVTLMGSIGCDENGRLNSSSAVLQGSMEVSFGRFIPLDLSFLPKYSLFPGQVSTFCLKIFDLSMLLFCTFALLISVRKCGCCFAAILFLCVIEIIGSVCYATLQLFRMTYLC